MRVPATTNNKVARQPAAVSLAPIKRPGGSIDRDELAERLDEAGIYADPDGAAAVGADVLSDPDGWVYAERTCSYAGVTIEGWRTDTPRSGRHPGYLMDRAVRLAAMLRLGCLDDDTAEKAKQVVVTRFMELLETIEPRRAPGRFEIPDAWRWGKEHVSRMTDEQARAQLGGHQHYGEGGLTMEAPDTDGTQSTKDDAAGWLSDAHVSELLVNRVLRGKYCWAPGLGWMRWDTIKWSRTTTEDVTEQSRLFACTLVANVARGGDPDKIRAYTRRMSAGAVRAAADLAKGQLLVGADQFDRHPDLLNVANGVVNLCTGELMAHDPGLLFTKCAPTGYWAGATHPDWTAALEALPPDARDWMQVRFGQAITGHPTSDDVLPVLHGSGSNGKTTITTGIDRALGEHAVTVPERVLLANPSDHPTELMTLRGARLALLEETPQARHLNVKRLKDVLGTTRMSARFIAKDTVFWSPTHSLFVSTNYQPRVEETDHGTWRRLAMVAFPYTYRKPGEKCTGPNDRIGDPTLRERLKAGGDGRHEAVLTWLVDGARRWYAGGWVMPVAPQTIVDSTRAWRHESDLILRWFDDALIADSGYYVPGSDLYNVFAGWLTTNGNQKWTSQTFAERFGQHDEIAGHGICHSRVRLSTTNLAASRPVWPSGVLPERFRAWVGVRFRTDADGDGGTRDQQKHDPGTAGTDVFGNSSNDTRMENYQNYPSRPSQDEAAGAESDRCTVCRQPMYAPVSVDRGMCERCWLARRGDDPPQHVNVEWTGS